MKRPAPGLLATCCLFAVAAAAFGFGALGPTSAAGVRDRVAPAAVTVVPAEPGPADLGAHPGAAVDRGAPAARPGTDGGMPPGAAALLEEGGTEGLPPRAVLGSATTVPVRVVLERLPIRDDERGGWVPRPSAAVSAEQRCELVVDAVVRRHREGLGVGPREYGVLRERLDGPCGDRLVQAPLPRPVSD